MRLGSKASHEPHARTFSTRPQSRRARWRLRGQSQRTLVLALVGLLLSVGLWFALPAHNRLSVASSNFWLQALGVAAETQLTTVPLGGVNLPLPVVHGATAAGEIHLGWHLLGLLLLAGTAHRLGRLRPTAGWALGGLVGIHALSVLAHLLGASDHLNLSDHSLALSLSTHVLLLFSPLLCVIVCLLQPAWWRRLIGCALLLSYLGLAEPLKLVTHAWLVQAAGPLMLPTLFLAFGPAFDALILAGILSSLLSLPPTPAEGR